MNLIILVPLILVILGSIWGLWLIFRKQDLVSKPGQMIWYFVGALLALLVAGFLTAIIVPAWANQLLSLATNSNDVRSFQDKAQQLIQQSMGQTVVPPTRTPVPVAPAPATPGATPVITGTISSESLAPGQSIHIVQQGETMYRIATHYGVTVQAIQQANRIADPNRISPGQRLIIPAKP